MFSSLRFFPDGRTSHSYVSVPARFRFGAATDLVRFANASRPLRVPNRRGELRRGELLPRLELCNMAWFAQATVTMADGETLEPGWLPCSGLRFRRFPPDGSPVPMRCEW